MGHRSYQQSMKYLECALKGLAELFGDGKRPVAEEVVKAAQAESFDWHPNSDNPLAMALRKSGVVNNRDLRMVVESLATEFDQLNIVERAIQQIEVGDLHEAYKRLDAVYNVGHKKASLFLREVVDVYCLRASCLEADYVYLFPVDIWVERVCIKLNFLTGTESIKEKPRAAVKACLEREVDPIRFNQGAWVLGSKQGDAGIDHFLQDLH